jgi:hypothetical protein
MCYTFPCDVCNNASIEPCSMGDVNELRCPDEVLDSNWTGEQCCTCFAVERVQRSLHMWLAEHPCRQDDYGGPGRTGCERGRLLEEHTCIYCDEYEGSAAENCEPASPCGPQYLFHQVRVSRVKWCWNRALVYHHDICYKQLGFHRQSSSPHSGSWGAT